MRNIWVVSDTHYGHANILKFTDMHSGNLIRPEFSSLEEMDEYMVERHNSVVKTGDIVYHLGDVFMGEGWKYLPRLNGSMRLILGNHDTGKDQRLLTRFQKIMMWRMFPEFNCVLTHVPIHESSLFKVQYNIHGHIHQNPAPTERHINASVELQEYTPKHIEDLMAGK